MYDSQGGYLIFRKGDRFRPVLQIGQISQSCLQEEKFHAEQLFSVAVCFDSFFLAAAAVRGDY